MSDRPTPEDVIDGLECGWCTTSLYGGSIVSALHDAGYRIVTAEDAAKLDRLRECEYDQRNESRVLAEQWMDYGTAAGLLAYLNGDGER